MKLTNLLLPALALGGAAMILGPAPTGDAYALLGGSLGTGQRDFRIFNNFTDPTANDNQVPNAQFPGHQGAVMAIWKASVEWGSTLHGDGTGDPHQPGTLGSGGANFDADFQGEANGIGTTNNNIHSELSGSAGGVLAYTESPISDGWRIRYYSSWTWADGPGSPPSNQIDLQGVACHEYGHALGLNHTNVPGATMYPSISGTGVGQRSIAPDDINGVQAVYGVKSAAKPVVTNAVVSGGNVTITGQNFSSTNNQVWFTNKNVTSTGVDPTVKVTGLASTGGGTQIVCPIPTDAGPGDLMVKMNASGNSSLSNAWPVDVTGSGGGGFGITSITPGVINALNPGSGQIITINGSGFTPATIVQVNGVDLFGIPSPWTVVNSSTITFDPPDAPFLGPVNVTVHDGPDTDTAQVLYIANPTPALECGDGDEPVTFFTAGGLDVTCAASPGSIFVLIASTSNQPSIVPGFFSLDIGNSLTNYVVVTQPTIGSNGLASLHLPVSLPPLTTFYMQGVVVGSPLSFPLEVSNVQECQDLF